MSNQNPYFFLFPINNVRTGYKPYAMPIVYIERHRKDTNGSGLANSETLSLKYYIANAPGPAKVAGPFNANLRVPDSALFEIILTSTERSSYLMNIKQFIFYDSNNNIINYSDAKTGDFFEYSLNGNKVTTKVPYYVDAYYYDFSTIQIDVEDLPRPKRYLFIWESSYYNRIASGTGEFKCLSDKIAITQLPIEIAHPGEVHEAMFRGTPSFAFDYENFQFQNDSTLEFYRPLADALQDIFDEQEFLDGINFIDYIPAEFIPYLAYLIGWDLPNFPGASNKLRRSILRNASALQKIKGTKRVITELFEIFGFTIDLINLWANKEGTKLLSSNDGLDVKTDCQVDLIVSDYASTGFGIDNSVPLTFRPTRDTDIILYAWLVNDGATKTQLLANNASLSSNLNILNDDSCNIDQTGLIIPIKLLSTIPNVDITVLGSSVVVIGKSSSSVGQPVLNHINITYDKVQNLLLINFDHEMSIYPNASIFIYAVYQRNEIIIPVELSNTRSNKFDIGIIDRATNEVPDFELLQFLLNFLFKLKAFHSLLRKIKITIDATDVYNVADFCLDGVDEYAPDSDLGKLHTPPAIIIDSEVNCVEFGSQFKASDNKLKNIILSGLEDEFQAWKALADNCADTKYGQDKVIGEHGDFDHTPDTRVTYCENDPSKPNYCYKGRVVGDVSFDLLINNLEIVQNNPCSPKMGMGFYWITRYDVVDFDSQNHGSLYNKINHRASDLLLHYTNESYYSDLLANPNYSLALDPISLNIEKDNLGFPGHRFITLNKLYVDYTSDYFKRPWDIDATCGFYDNSLNAHIVDLICTNPNDLGIPCESLVYDEVSLVYPGNGLIPDVDSMDSPSTPTAVITHELYQNTIIPHPSLTDDFEITSVESITFGSYFGSIFNSACNNTSDYISGYPAKYNETTIEKTDYQFTDGVSYLDRTAIATAIGLPNQVKATKSYYYLNSMILLDKADALYQFYKPYRFDCGCLNSCPTFNPAVACNLNSFIDKDGDLDVGCDKLQVDIVAVLFDTFNSCGIKLNDEIKTLFCINDDCSIPNSGEFRYKDSYNIIYEVAWVLSENVLDISTTIKDPKIPGQEPTGYKDKDGNIFRRGIITSWRKIFKIVGDDYTLLSESSEPQRIDFYKDNVKCGDPKFDDPFTYVVDCGISDDVELIISGGPRWTDPTDDPSGDDVEVQINGNCTPTGIYWWDVNPSGSCFVDDPYGLYWIDFVNNADPDLCDIGHDESSESSSSLSTLSSSSSSSSTPSSESTESSSLSTLSTESSSSSNTPSSISTESSSLSSQSTESSSSSTLSSISSLSSQSTVSSESTESSSLSTLSSSSSSSSSNTPSSESTESSSLSTLSSESSSSSSNTPSSQSTESSSSSSLSSNTPSSKSSSLSSNTPSSLSSLSSGFGYDWTLRAAPYGVWRRIAYGNNTFVAVSTYGGARVMTSTDAINWDVHALAESNTIYSICFGNGIFVAVGGDGTHRVQTSPNGIDWTPQDSPLDQWFTVGYGNGLFIAVNGVSFSDSYMTSPNGIDWTPHVFPATGTWEWVTYGGGQWVCIDRGGGDTYQVMTSPNGTDWTGHIIDEAYTGGLSVCYGNGVYVIVCISGDNRIWTSPNGIDWTGQPGPSVTQWKSVSFGGGIFVTCGGYGDINKGIATSTDGYHWYEAPNPSASEWYDSCYGNGVYVMVADFVSLVATSGI